MDKQTEGLLLRGWAQEFVRARTGMALQEMIFHQQYMSQRQWDARVKREENKLLAKWANEDRAYLQERLRVADDARTAR